MGWWKPDPPSVAGWLGWFTFGFTKKKLNLRVYYYLGIMYIFFFSWGTKLLSCIYIYIYMYINIYMYIIYILCIYIYMYIIHILIELYSPCLLHVHDEPLLNRWSLGQPSIGMMATSAGPGQRPMRPQPKPKQLAPQKCDENGDLQGIYPLKMVIFHSYVSLPEGNSWLKLIRWNDYWKPWFFMS